LEKPSNVFSRRIIEYGDIHEGFAQSDLTFEYTFTTPATHQAYLEPHNCLVSIDGEGRVQVWASNKAPFLLRKELSAAVGVPVDHILVNHAPIGGDFGGKGSSMDVPLCYFLAQKTGRPVRMVMDYVEELGAGNPRHPSVIRLRTGVTSDGTLVALEGTIIFNAGAYGGFTPMGFLPGAYHLAGSYRIPHTYTEALQVYTNCVPGGHMRGPGEAQVMFAMESNIDCIAREMDIDPFDFRMANLVRNGDTAGSGEQYENIVAQETLQAAAEAADYRAPKPINVGRGIGMGDRAPGGGETHVALTLSQDGSAVLHTSVYDQGAGSYTTLRQIVAEETGLNPEDIEISVWDTATGAFDSGMGASRNTRMVSQAAHEAAQKVLLGICNLATEILGWPAEQLVLTGRNMTRRDTGEDHAWADVLTRAGQTVTGQGDFKDMSRSPVTSFTAQIAEVSVDPETGEVQLLRFVSAHDVGTILHPVGHQGQVNGGVIQGVGYALTEQLLTEDGRITNVTFGDYKIPSIMDIPPMKTVLLESKSGVGPYAIKGIGENPIGPVAPAIANAIADAIGVRINDLPFTAEKVYRALRSK
jgi:CO/xanthine dehydrogenase Mo-binding subunit